MHPEHVLIETKEGLLLPGLFYRAPRSKKALILLHGNGGSSIIYDKERDEALAKALSRKGVSYLAFNNRGANVVKNLYIRSRGKTKKIHGGMAHEVLKDAVEDIDSAIRFLKKRGFKQFYLIGFSTGANKICVYDYYKKKNSVSKYIMVGGGDDTGIYYDMLGRQKFFRMLERAKQKRKSVATRHEIAPDLLPLIFSWRAFYDIANPNGDYNTFPFYEVLRKTKLSKKPLFRYFKAITKPMLVIYGGEDEHAWGSVPKIVEILKKQHPKANYKIVEGADHGLRDHTKELAKIVTGWL